jgi:hypothetical protein
MGRVGHGGAQAQKVAAAAGQGRPGVIVIDELRPARGSDIPVGTFTEPDGTATPGVAWQERPAGVGDHLEGVRVGDRAWSPGVRIGVMDVVVVVAVLAILLWRLLALVRHVRQRR